ncbi:MAG: HAD-IIB family hydrolase [Fuerstiella sp.]|jgi:mannosyl-3-phosphoglycerate phosphatase|nr:HAD-IIB family hydrolase [Fuerstiella sp.]MCP4513307.1 HAD-IIB family hydrolase [Fuerstiella sp.]MDG2129171.1 HAD-IIB family hydrolase [Fuerstiella sp.]
MNEPPNQLVVFTDLDGCLLNKVDYDWSAAEPVLRRLEQLSVPVVLSSSKTVAEMSELRRELCLPEAPFISENGGVIQWSKWLLSSNEASSVPAERVAATTKRSTVLDVLTELKNQFQFRSFVDLGVEGVMANTDLPREKAELACQRHSTEPLLWEDTDDNIRLFLRILTERGLTLTKGGRFWHVAGNATKGHAMHQVADRYRDRMSGEITTAAIGDSPIDQSMLDIADYPIGIPAVDGQLNVEVDPHRGIVASQDGAAGWAETVRQLLLRLGIEDVN